MKPPLPTPPVITRTVASPEGGGTVLASPRASRPGRARAINRLRGLAAGACTLFALGACARAPQADIAALPQAAARVEAPAAQTAHTPPAPAQPGAANATSTAWPSVLVHKSPTCGCCSAWVEHLRQSGFEVRVNETDDLEPVKRRLGVPLGKGSCHTAEIGRYVVEGHVPAEDIKRLIAQGDDSRGLVLPGMPAGSPGMEMPDGRVQPYIVERIDAQGATHPFAAHGDGATAPDALR